jgi:hypothetical protein
MAAFMQDSISIASSILAITCLMVPLIFKKELKGLHEKYFLISFYISAILHFMTVSDPIKGPTISRL